MTESRDQIIDAIQAEIDADDEYITELNVVLDNWCRELDATLADRDRLVTLLAAAATTLTDHTPVEPDPTPPPAPAQAKAPKQAGIKKPATGKRNGPAPTVNLEQVAAVYNQFATTGARNIVGALATHFEVPLTTAKNWPNKLRKAGLIPPAGSALVQVAAPTVPTVVERPVGWDGTGTAGPPGESVVVGFECDNCGYRSVGDTIEARSAMRTHVREIHGRMASTFEMAAGVLE